VLAAGSRRDGIGSPADLDADSAAPSRPRTSIIDGPVQRLGFAEANIAIDPDGRGVLGGDFQVRPAPACLIKPLDGLADQRPAQAEAPVRGHDPHVLNSADRASIHDSLDRTAKIALISDQPGRAWQKTRLLADLPHQTLATQALPQTGKDLGIDLV